jgi:hypothetical protein
MTDNNSTNANTKKTNIKKTRKGYGRVVVFQRPKLNSNGCH